MSSIFLAHSDKDHDFVLELAKKLNQCGVKTWVDKAELEIGDSIMKKIGEAIEQMKFVGVVISKNSIKSDWVQKELDLAMIKQLEAKEVVVLPILIETCKLPNVLKGTFYADFTKQENYNQVFSELLNKVMKTQDPVGKNLSPEPSISEAELRDMQDELMKMREKVNSIITESEEVLKQAGEAVSKANKAWKVSREKTQRKSRTLYKEAEEKLNSAKDKIASMKCVSAEQDANASLELANKALNIANEEEELYKKIRKKKVENAWRRVLGSLIGWSLLFGLIGMVAGWLCGYPVLGSLIGGVGIGFVFGIYNILKELW